MYNINQELLMLSYPLQGLVVFALVSSHQLVCIIPVHLCLTEKNISVLDTLSKDPRPPDTHTLMSG